MKNLRRVGIALALAAVLVLSGGIIAALGERGKAPLTAGSAAAESVADTRSVTVSGQGTVFIKPDTAQVTLGAQANAPDVATALQEVNQKMDAVLAALKAQGIADDQIKTVNFSIFTQQDPSKSDGSISGYQVQHTVQVKIKPVEKVGAIIDAATGAGANVVFDVAFTVENQDAAVRQAREQAMADAKARAEHLAQLAGATLGAPLAISEGAAMPPVPLPVARDAVGLGAGAAAVQPGQTSVSVSVTVSYAMQ